MSEHERELSVSGYYAEAIEEFDTTLDDVASAVAAVSSEGVRDILDRYKAATHRLLKAHRIQVIDDVQDLLGNTQRGTDRRLRNLELLTQGRASADFDDPTGTDAGAHPSG